MIRFEPNHPSDPELTLSYTYYWLFTNKTLTDNSLTALPSSNCYDDRCRATRVFPDVKYTMYFYRYKIFDNYSII
jgi:hypothetical protein